MGRRLTDTEKKYLSDLWIGKKKSKSHAENIRKSKQGTKNPMYGRQLSDEHAFKLKMSRKGKPSWNKGKKCPELATNWQGGKSSESHIIRHSMEYRQWRIAVFERDNYTCQVCGLRFIKGLTGNVVLNADHIKQFAYYPELRFELSNGRTLCEDCHKTTPTYRKKQKALS